MLKRNGEIYKKMKIKIINIKCKLCSKEIVIEKVQKEQNKLNVKLVVLFHWINIVLNYVILIQKWKEVYGIKYIDLKN